MVKARRYCEACGDYRFTIERDYTDGWYTARCYACRVAYARWEVRSGSLPKGVYEEVEKEEGPFDTTRTMIDGDGNTLVWDKEREIYVNCGVQNGR